jgi:peptidoglycan/xylan/chitin deacetylase (PgdA/CDA1 family)
MNPALSSVVLEHRRYQSAAPRNALTVDVEEHFQVAAFEAQIARDAWGGHDSRVVGNTSRVLDLFAQASVRGTFFVLGWVAERHPGLIRRIVAEGHELASHGYDHTRVIYMDAVALRGDVSRTKAILEDAGGVRVRGYRAPSYSINSGNLWALDAPRFAFRLRPGAILEIPVTTVRFGGRNLPAGGGGYFRLMPYGLYRWGLRRVNERDSQPGMFYFHPWEVDPDQPRIEGAPLRSRLRHYTNLRTMEARLRRLLADFHWGRMDEVFDV